MDFLADINNAAPEAILAGFGLVGLLIGATLFIGLQTFGLLAA